MYQHDWTLSEHANASMPFLSFARTVNADEPNSYIDIVFRLSYSLHKELYEQIREDLTVHEVLVELMKEDVEAIRAKTWKEAIMAVATNMLMQHQGLSQIVRATDLPEGEVRDLAASLGLAIETLTYGTIGPDGPAITPGVFESQGPT